MQPPEFEPEPEEESNTEEEPGTCHRHLYIYMIFGWFPPEVSDRFNSVLSLSACSCMGFVTP